MSQAALYKKAILMKYYFKGVTVAKGVPFWFTCIIALGFVRLSVLIFTGISS